MDDETQRAIALTANGFVSAILVLEHCLKSSGALIEGQFESGLEDAINASEAESDRLDYQILAHIRERLQGKSPPPFQVILGGKYEED